MTLLPLSSAEIQRLGWTLLHFLWQGTAIVAVYSMLRGLGGRSMSAQGRYTLACVTLLAMAITPLLTFLLMPKQGGVLAPVAAWTISASAWQRLLPAVVAVWLVGVLLYSIRLFGGWRFTMRLRSTSHPAPAEWQQRLARIGAEVGASRPMRLFVSSLVNVPTVVGWLRPMILVPVASLAGLPAEHLAALLAHEVAHIRRNDYFASVLQSIIEAVLFYHPAVWWISAQVRAERELCCDDVAVSVCGDVLTYARALAELESQQTPYGNPVLAANGGSLVNRIRRLIEPASPVSNNVPAPGAAWAMALLWFAGAGATAIPAAQTPLPLPHVVNHGPSPFAVVSVPAPELASPAIALAAHARRTLLFDPFLPAQMPQTQVSDADKLPAPWRKWLDEDAAYIIAVEERKAFLELTTDEERTQFVEKFWSRRDPTPNTVQNEFKEEHYRRIAYANQRFSSRTPGWKTDRGRVYITYGAPDQIESHPSDERTAPFEVWRYRFIEGIGANAILQFTDLANTGEYRLAPNALPENPSMKGWPAVLELAVNKPEAPYAGPDVGMHNTYTILPMRVQVDYLRMTGSTTMANVTVQLENKDLQFQMENGTEKTLVNILGRVTTASRRPVTMFEYPLATFVPPELLAKTMQNRSIFQHSMTLSPGHYRMNVIAKDVISGNLNNYEVALDVPEFADDKLSSSSLILADMIEKIPAKRPSTMFSMGDMKVRPRAGTGFTAGEKLGVYLELYNFKADEATQKPSGTIEYEIDKSGTGEKVLDVSEEVAQVANASASQVTIGKMLSLSTLTPGAYTLKVTAIDRNGNQTLQRQGAFTVNPQ